jgi:beta-galactosidase
LVVSTVLDPAGKEVGKDVTAAVSIGAGGEQMCEQEVTVSQPRLWSLEERNLYTLVSEVRLGGDVVDRYETRFGIRSIHFDADKGLLLNGKPVKVKGTCNHQDHAGVGAAVPDDLGMLVFDETRMMSSNPEGLSQFENLVRRDRNHPSVFMWSMGNEERTAKLDKGVGILTAMKAVAMRHDGSRPVSIAPTAKEKLLGRKRDPEDRTALA